MNKTTFPALPAPVRAVVIGYGFAGRAFHSYLIGLTPGMELRGVASREAATRARIVAERACHAYDDLDAVLADPDVDLVVLATPSKSHAAQAIAALEAGKHVVTDKVMCLSLAECDAMLAAAERADRVLTVFQNRRWDGDFLTVQRLMAAGDTANSASSAGWKWRGRVSARGTAGAGRRRWAAVASSISGRTSSTRC